MSTNHTTNYNLNQWGAADKVLRTEFNADNAKIDAALKSHDDELAGLETAIGAKGNCRVCLSSYVGTGEGGSPYPNTLTFAARPVLVLIRGEGSTATAYLAGGGPMFIPYSDGNSTCDAEWSEDLKTVSWYHGRGNAATQMNSEGVTYLVCAICFAEE